MHALDSAALAVDATVDDLVVDSGPAIPTTTSSIQAGHPLQPDITTPSIFFQPDRSFIQPAPWSSSPFSRNCENKPLQQAPTYAHPTTVSQSTLIRLLASPFPQPIQFSSSISILYPTSFHHQPPATPTIGHGCPAPSFRCPPCLPWTVPLPYATSHLPHPTPFQFYPPYPVTMPFHHIAPPSVCDFAPQTLGPHLTSSTNPHHASLAGTSFLLHPPRDVFVVPAIPSPTTLPNSGPLLFAPLPLSEDPILSPSSLSSPPHPSPLSNLLPHQKPLPVLNLLNSNPLPEPSTLSLLTLLPAPPLPPKSSTQLPIPPSPPPQLGLDLSPNPFLLLAHSLSPPLCPALPGIPGIPTLPFQRKWRMLATSLCNSLLWAGLMVVSLLWNGLNNTSVSIGTFQALATYPS